MNYHSLTGTHTFPFSPSLPILRTIINVTNYNHFSVSTSRRFTLHRLCKTPNFQVVRCSMKENRILEPEDAALLISKCITRTLSPALTLEQGLEKIKEAVEELKAKPPCCSSGMFRFQVAVPPSAKSLNWFCCQPKSSGVFPQFFLSKEKQNPSCKSIVLGHTRGIFGIGAAISLKGFSATKEYGEFGRTPSDEGRRTSSESPPHQPDIMYHFVLIPELELTLLSLTLLTGFDCVGRTSFNRSISSKVNSSPVWGVAGRFGVVVDAAVLLSGLGKRERPFGVHLAVSPCSHHYHQSSPIKKEWRKGLDYARLLVRVPFLERKRR
ncbi:hypothetical protein HAX54_044960 [Datura stramonium]|uniref:Uncharacterized protein n=1 Tax=Datura stramonium TaxID=4076 RepID=A0ABS8SPR5_DATST|nr:hypothetical protein [Datura stramonium]